MKAGTDGTGPAGLRDGWRSPVARTRANGRPGVVLLLCCMLALPELAPALAQSSPDEESVDTRSEPRDGSHDFDFEFGEWTTHLKRLQRPLSGSTTWLEYKGTSTVRGILNGRANIVELVVEGPAGRIEGASLRLYDPRSRQWTLNFFNVNDGQLTPPVVGGFRAGRGEFYAQDTFDGRAIFVRFVISKVSADVYRFEQAFSADGGQTWEVNWIATDTRR
jgi:hypothetical protein